MLERRSLAWTETSRGRPREQRDDGGRDVASVGDRDLRRPDLERPRALERPAVKGEQRLAVDVARDLDVAEGERRASRVPSAFIAASFAAKRPATCSAKARGCRRARRISPSRKTRERKRSPWRSSTPAMRSTSVRSRPSSSPSGIRAPSSRRSGRSCRAATRAPRPPARRVPGPAPGPCGGGAPG